MLARFRGRTEGMQAFDTFHIPGVIYKANGREGGHVRLFRKPCGGLSIYAWNQTNPEWPLVERWYIPGLLTIARVTPGTAGTAKMFGRRPGWHFLWPKIAIKRIYGGYSFQYMIDKGYSL